LPFLFSEKILSSMFSAGYKIRITRHVLPLLSRSHFHSKQDDRFFKPR
jgi:hypothetical protein